VFNRVSVSLLGLLALSTACGQRDLEREQASNEPAGSESDEADPGITEAPPPEMMADPGAVPPASDERSPDDLDLVTEPMPGDGPAMPEMPVTEAPPAPPFSASYHIGADITWVQHDELYGATFVDTDGETKDILDLMKNHGFNSVRLRAFVDPRAADGYDQFDGFGDIAHTVEMAERVRRAGMGLYISVHLSDNWADPGKQCVPVAWQADTFEQLTAHVHDYVFELVSALAAADATPQLVQVGNEITGGILRHICDSAGLPIGNAAVNGSAANWDNLGTLLRAGLEAVKEVDPEILSVLHIDKAGDLGASVDFLDNALAQELEFDVFADTAYVRWQGQPSAWQNTFTTLESMFPELSFVIPEYGNETATSPATPSTMRIANDIMFNLPDHRGVGTWFYEPEHPTQAGIGIGVVELATTAEGVTTDPWPEFRVTAESMAVYDQLKVDFASRL
jgi:arabinogalactan endo-1,4-beta-galactosidase